jgi:signal transduction histidine kinase
MQDFSIELTALAHHLHQRRSVILQHWRAAVAADPALTTGNSLPRSQLNDHIPAVLADFGRELGHPLDQDGADAAGTASSAQATATAAAHGLHRWQQGYDLREVTRELGRLNECMVLELERYARAHPELDPEVMTIARARWARSCGLGIEESTAQYFRLQQTEASGHLQELEHALESIHELEHQRAELWRQVAHDLRGNVGVVATATQGLGRDGLAPDVRERFLRALDRNVGGLRHLLDDVTSLARLNAGNEQRQPVETDIGSLMKDLCDGLLPLAQHRDLWLRSQGPVPFVVQADPSKTRRLAQNLLMNAIKYTTNGGVSITWGDSDPQDKKRWALTIEDTGPGLASPGEQDPLTSSLVGATRLPHGAPDGGAPGEREADTDTPAISAIAAAMPPAQTPRAGASPQPGGEGIGLSIVKRLCELLDASVELRSAVGHGTSFRILLPRKYPAPHDTNTTTPNGTA